MVMGKQSIVMGWYCYLVEKKKKKEKRNTLSRAMENILTLSMLGEIFSRQHF